LTFKYVQNYVVLRSGLLTVLHLFCQLHCMCAIMLLSGRYWIKHRRKRFRGFRPLLFNPVASAVLYDYCRRIYYWNNKMRKKIRVSIFCMSNYLSWACYYSASRGRSTKRRNPGDSHTTGTKQRRGWVLTCPCRTYLIFFVNFH